MVVNTSYHFHLQFLHIYFLHDYRYHKRSKPALLLLVAEILTIACICIFMFFADWSIALVVLVLAIVCVLLIFFLFRKKMFEAGVEARKYSIKIDQALAQSFLGVKDVLLLRKQKHFIGEYERNKIYISQHISKLFTIPEGYISQFKAGMKFIFVWCILLFFS